MLREFFKLKRKVLISNKNARESINFMDKGKYIVDIVE